MTRDVARLSARTFDLLVIGGGIYGLTIAADASQRGLSVALVERNDFGSGSSFNHLRTIHGGLRYLQTLDIARARESIAERRTLARIAPHAVRPLPFVLPLTARLLKGPLMMRAGFLLDAVVARDRNDGVRDDLRLPAGRVLSRSAAVTRFPGLAGTPMVGAAVWHDYVAVEADRLTLSWALAAARAGAALANYVDATSLIIDGRRVAGATAVDRFGTGTVEIAARTIVNATGADIDRLLVTPRIPTHTPLLRAMNLVTRLDGGDVAVGRQATGGRALFMIPWHGRALFGTWESGATCGPDQAAPPEEDVASFVREVALAFPTSGLTRQDVTLVHRGVVPAVVDGDGRVSLDGRQRVRDHANGPDALEGLISIAGTKYTTARSAAEQITNRLFAKLGRPLVPCRTATAPLPGADTDAPPPEGDARTWPNDVRAHMEAAYGAAGHHVVHLAGEDPALAERVTERSPVVAAQLVWAVRHEMAMTLADAVIRRTPLGALGHPGAPALERAASILARECRWGAARQKREVDAVDAFYGT